MPLNTSRPARSAGPARLGPLSALIAGRYPRRTSPIVTWSGLSLSGALWLVAASPAHALEVGFEAYGGVTASDNVGGSNSPDEEDGLLGVGLIGIYGEQRASRIDIGFEGEIDGRRRFDDEERDSIDTVTRFLGAAEIALTPRALSWYVGDILGGVRPDNAIQPINDNDDSVRQRNVFVTGPELDYSLGSDTRLGARLLYINQSEEGEALESLWNANIDWRRDTLPESYFGFSLNDIYTDNSGVDTDDTPSFLGDGTGDSTDFNRVSAAAYWNRVRGFVELYGQIGATRYDTGRQESLNGLNAALRATRTLGPSSALTLALRRDLSDQTLSTVESLVDDGSGVQPEADGFFEETRAELVYRLKARLMSAELGAGVATLDYRLLGGQDGVALDGASEDQTQAYFFGSLSRSLTSRLRTELGTRYERQSFSDRADETDSILGSVRLLYRVARSFELEAGYIFDRAQGIRTRLVGSGTADAGFVREGIDVTENRVTFGIRWAPPSRANRDLTIELKSLLR